MPWLTLICIRERYLILFHELYVVTYSLLAEIAWLLKLCTSQPSLDLIIIAELSQKSLFRQFKRAIQCFKVWYIFRQNLGGHWLLVTWWSNLNRVISLSKNWNCTVVYNTVTLDLDWGKFLELMRQSESYHNLYSTFTFIYCLPSKWEVVYSFNLPRQPTLRN